MTGTLYLIPNTLGLPGPDDAQQFGLHQIIPDYVQALSASLDYFVAENAKSTRAYLKLLAQSHPLRKVLQEIEIAELNIQTPAQRLPDLLAPLLQGRDAGLISEAGVPAVADPGSNLVRLAHQHGVKVKPLVGPSSLLLALMGSGLNGQSFAFHGYLPQDAEARSKRIKELETRSQKEQQTQLFIETPYRNGALLQALLAQCQPQTLLCCATDLSLPTEQVRTMRVADWKKQDMQAIQHSLHKKPTVFLFLAGV